jgi:hypothetical protein
MLRHATGNKRFPPVSGVEKLVSMIHLLIVALGLLVLALVLSSRGELAIWVGALIVLVALPVQIFLDSKAYGLAVDQFVSRAPSMSDEEIESTMYDMHCRFGTHQRRLIALETKVRAARANSDVGSAQGSIDTSETAQSKPPSRSSLR